VEVDPADPAVAQRNDVHRRAGEPQGIHGNSEFDFFKTIGREHGDAATLGANLKRRPEGYVRRITLRGASSPSPHLHLTL
jgi:hypothetical protein